MGKKLDKCTNIVHFPPTLTQIGGRKNYNEEEIRAMIKTIPVTACMVLVSATASAEGLFAPNASTPVSIQFDAPNQMEASANQVAEFYAALEDRSIAACADKGEFATKSAKLAKYADCVSQLMSGAV